MSPAGELVGVVGGTLDPVHLGHLHIARQVALAFDLRRVLLVPCWRQPHKPNGPVASATDRLEMVRLAAAGDGTLEASAIEIERAGISFTIDTLDELRARGVVPLFIIGLDSLGDLPTWREHDRLVREFDLVAVDRRGSAVEGGSEVVPVPSHPGAGGELPGAPPGAGGRIFHLRVSTIDVSSSLVRARVAAGKTIVGLVPATVARYIQEHRLYSKEMNR